jgi:hypothetical protein
MLGTNWKIEVVTRLILQSQFLREDAGKTHWKLQSVWLLLERVRKQASTEHGVAFVPTFSEFYFLLLNFISYLNEETTVFLFPSSCN